MGNTSKRGERRAALRRMKNRARQIYSHDVNGTLANHLAACSGLCCGNQRRHTGKPRHSELRAMSAHQAGRQNGDAGYERHAPDDAG